MSAIPTIEERLSALERDVAQLKRQRMAGKSTTVEKCREDEEPGSMKDIREAHFDEFVTYCREPRLNEGKVS